MKKYLVATDVEKANGSQTWTVIASSREEAERLVDEGKGEFEEEEIEVYSLGKAYVTDELRDAKMCGVCSHWEHECVCEKRNLR